MLGLSVTVLVLSSLLGHTRAKSTIHYLHWNSTNPIFRIDNTDHIVDVNEGWCQISKVGHIYQLLFGSQCHCQVQRLRVTLDIILRGHLSTINPPTIKLLNMRDESSLFI